ncbi:MAG TPA: hypothetical protein VEQ37_04410 [Actinomycetota bacterium]|nr:hypothetical protein [Actinomycetota bacterium]
MSRADRLTILRIFPASPATGSRFTRFWSIGRAALAMETAGSMDTTSLVITWGQSAASSRHHLGSVGRIPVGHQSP